jgi:hypothetical protein
VTRFAIDITCPQCAGPVTFTNGASSGLLAVTILACDPCRRQWEVSARITVHRTPEQIRSTNTRNRSRERPRERVGA